MSKDMHKSGGTKVFKAIETLLFLSPTREKPENKKTPPRPDDIKNRVLLKIERAEIMSAMMAMRSDAEIQETNNQ